MSFNLTLGGHSFQMLDFSVQEATTPLSAGDSSGQVGTLNITIPYPDEEVVPDHPIVLYGVNWLANRDIRLSDTRKGFTIGKVSSVQSSRESGTIQISGVGRLGLLNVFNVQAQPFSGTLGNVFRDYMRLAGVTTGILVDPSVESRRVVFPGWNGELWYHLKQLALAIDCDVALVSGIILLRPIRAREITRGRDVDRGSSTGGGQLAQNISIVQYNNRAITNQLVYPPGGWSEEVTTFNVNAGESIEETLELSASVSSVSQPVMQTFVSKAHRNSSVFTVVGDDGLPIPPAQWTAQGGRLRVTINPDTVSLTLHVTAPRGIRNKDNKEVGVYGIALSSDSSTGRYSTLRIVGSGVAFDKEEVLVPTGITDRETATEVGLTIDNPFLSTRDQVYTAGIRAVRGFNGTSMTISGTVTAVNQRGDTGIVQEASYADIQIRFAGMTYQQVEASLAGMSYLQVHASFNVGAEDRFENQVFGNVSGARVWDEPSRRWYRVMTNDAGPGVIQFDAEDDLTHADARKYWDVETYADMQMLYNGFSYQEVDLMGLRPVKIRTPQTNPGG